LLRYVANYNHAALYPANLPVRFLGDIFPGIHDKDICFRHDVEDKGLPYGEAYVLACLAVYLKPRKVFEIGTFTGGAALLMARHAGPDCRVYTLVVPPGQHANLSLPGVSHDPAEANAGIIGSRFRGTEYERQITQLYGD